jgi:hypothetical protein
MEWKLVRRVVGSQLGLLISPFMVDSAGSTSKKCDGVGVEQGVPKTEENYTTSILGVKHPYKTIFEHPEST